jgi:hypothetical protein
METQNSSMIIQPESSDQAMLANLSSASSDEQQQQQ